MCSGIARMATPVINWREVAIVTTNTDVKSSRGKSKIAIYISADIYACHPRLVYLCICFLAVWDTAIDATVQYKNV